MNMNNGKRKNIRLILGLSAACVLLVMVVGVASASAEVQCGSCTPWWQLGFQSTPANLSPGGEGEVDVVAEDLGDALPNASSSVVLTAKLPAGLTAQKVGLVAGSSSEENAGFFGEAFCTVLPGEVTCTMEGPLVEGLFSRLYDDMEAQIKVKVGAGAHTGEQVSARIAGGGAASVSGSTPVVVSAAPTRFGIDHYALRAENADGSPDTQAGSHPFQLTTDIGLNQGAERVPAAPLKDLHFDLPPGLVGNPVPFPQCPVAKFTGNAQSGQNFCPDNTVVGAVSVIVTNGTSKTTFEVPLFALVPSVGEPARFGVLIVNIPIFLDTSIRTGGDYGVTVSVDNITELEGFVSSRVTFWGVPGDPRHDAARGWNCLEAGANDRPPCEAFGEGTPPPLLTLPTACTGPVHTTVEGDSWTEEGAFTPPTDYVFKDNLGRPVGLDGCNQLPFTPSVKVT